MKKLFAAFAIIFMLGCILTSCDLVSQDEEYVVEVVDGYVVVNGDKTDIQAKDESEDKTENKKDVITVVDGYLVVNGVKTEYKIDSGAEKPEEKEDVITVVDGYLVVNGVKTEYKIADCDHIWNTITTEPSCTAGGYDTMTCILCDKSVKVNETSAIDHTYETNYTIDKDYHWYKCSVCGEVKDKAFHTLDGDGVCTVCDLAVTATPGVNYQVSADGSYAEVIGYEGTAKKIKIAEEYNGLPVKNICASAFRAKEITSVVIPDSVTNISDSAFYGCYFLTSVVIGNNVTNIERSAFSNCENLLSVVIPDSVTSIGESAFERCTVLSSVVIGNSVTEIGNSAFGTCPAITSLVIPDSVTTIGSYAFCYCRNLSSLVIGSGVTNIANSAFLYCNSSLFTEYECGKYVASGDNPYAVLIEVTSSYLTNPIIHEDTKIIAYGVFIGSNSLNTVVIPDSVTAISSNAFLRCYSLKSVVIGNGMTHINSNAFSDCTGLNSLVLGNSLTYIGKDAFNGCTSLSSVVIPDSVEIIDNNVFRNCSVLSHVVIGKGVTSLGNSVFVNCPKITEINYTGTEEDWSKITVGTDNKELTKATINYNYVPEN